MPPLSLLVLLWKNSNPGYLQLSFHSSPVFWLLNLAGGKYPNVLHSLTLNPWPTELKWVQQFELISLVYSFLLMNKISNVLPSLQSFNTFSFFFIILSWWLWLLFSTEKIEVIRRVHPFAAAVTCTDLLASMLMFHVLVCYSEQLSVFLSKPHPSSCALGPRASHLLKISLAILERFSLLYDQFIFTRM